MIEQCLAANKEEDNVPVFDLSKKPLLEETKLSTNKVEESKL